MSVIIGAAPSTGERIATLHETAAYWHSTQDGIKFAAVAGQLPILYKRDPLGTLDRVQEAAACLLDAADIRDGVPGWQTKLVTYLDWIDPEARRFLSDESTPEIREAEETARSVASGILSALAAEEAAATMQAVA